jgi:hypothetical protein
LLYQLSYAGERKDEGGTMKENSSPTRSTVIVAVRSLKSEVTGQEITRNFAAKPA